MGINLYTKIGSIFIYQDSSYQTGVLMLQARSYIRKKIHVSGNEYYYIHIPSKLAHDSQFPFRDGDELRIAVDVSRNRMIIEKINGKKKQKNKK